MGSQAKRVERRLSLAACAGWVPERVRRSFVEVWINLRNGRFRGSRDYWVRRYKHGGDSGTGSAGDLAQFKANFLNDLTSARSVESLVEFGCGDGRQAALFEVDRYVGLDIAADAVRAAAALNEGDHRKSFFLFDESAFFDRAGVFRADMAVSLDVLYHLVEPATRDQYLSLLFDSARTLVVIYSTHPDDGLPEPNHIKHWDVPAVVEPIAEGWRLHSETENSTDFSIESADISSTARFYVYERVVGPA